MRIVRDIAVGVAAAAIFEFVGPRLITLPEAWKIAGLVATFLIAFLIAATVGSEEPRSRVMSDVETDRDMTALISKSEIDGATDVMSGNRVRGNADFSIEDTKLGSK